MQSRKILAAVAVLPLLLLAACAAGASAPEKAITSYYSALAKKDYDTACTLIPPDLKTALGKNCANMLKTVATSGPAAKFDYSKIKVPNKIEVKDNTAKVKVGVDKTTLNVTVIKFGDKWYVDPSQS